MQEVGEQYLDLASPGSLPSLSILFVSNVYIKGEGVKLTLMEDTPEPLRSSNNIILLAIVHYTIPYNLLHIIKELLSGCILTT